MNRRTFLEALLPKKGLYCLKTLDKNYEGRQLFFDTIEELDIATDKLQGKPLNLFFAVASFDGERHRKKENVTYLRTFFLDVDCGEKKDYDTAKEALVELKRFCKTVGLPKPYVVTSGGGLHIYWPLHEQVTRSQWEAVALALKELCKEHDFHADHALTADCARVLRLPETRNHKYDPPKECAVMYQGVTTSYEDFKGIVGEVEAPLKTLISTNNAALGGINKQLLGNKEAEFKRIIVASLSGKGCNQIAYLYKNQEDVPEPLWRAGLSIAQFCVDRDKAIHKISKKHSEYSYDRTEAKATEIPAPQLCSTFSDANPDGCKDCPLRNKIKSPISIGMRVQEAENDGVTYAQPEPEPAETVEAPSLSLPNAPVQQYKIPVYPFPYIRGKLGGVYVTEQVADGPDEEVLLYPHDLYVVKRTFDASSGEALILRVHLPQDGVREFNMDMTAATSNDELRKELSSQGISVYDYSKLRRYVMRWVNELQVTSKADEAYRTFGWTNHKMEAFVLGNQKFTEHGVEFNPPSIHTKPMFPVFEPRGSLLEWQNAISIWNDPKFVVQQYALGMGFGSVLMEFAKETACAVHFYSKESGVGKSTMLEAMSSIWGNPEGLIIAKEDTGNFKMNRAELYHSLPLPLDEITNLTGEAASDLVYQFTSGKQRGRMQGSVNVERERGEAWSLMVATTGNTSVLEIISGFKRSMEGEAQRVLECQVPRLFDTTADKPTTDAFGRGIAENYGHAGPAFIKFVMRNKELVRETAIKIGQRVDQLAQLTAENRNWSAQVTYTLTGLIVAKKAGLIDFNIQHILGWAVGDLIYKNKVGVAAMVGSALDHVKDYISEHVSNILRIDSVVDRRGLSVDEQCEVFQVPEEVARGKLVARYEPDTKTYYLVIGPLRAWCNDNSIPYKSLKSELEVKSGATSMSMRVTKGFKLDLGKMWVIKLRLDEDELTDRANPPIPD